MYGDLDYAVSVTNPSVISLQEEPGQSPAEINLSVDVEEQAVLQVEEDMNLDDDAGDGDLGIGLQEGDLCRMLDARRAAKGVMGEKQTWGKRRRQQAREKRREDQRWLRAGEIMEEGLQEEKEERMQQRAEVEAGRGIG